MSAIDISKIEKIITYNYNEFGKEFGDTLVDLKREYIELQDTLKDREEYCDKLEEDRENILIENKKQKEVLDKIKEYCIKEKVLPLGEQVDYILELLEEIE